MLVKYVKRQFGKSYVPSLHQIPRKIGRKKLKNIIKNNKKVLKRSQTMKLTKYNFHKRVLFIDSYYRFIMYL